MFSKCEMIVNLYKNQYLYIKFKNQKSNLFSIYSYSSKNNTDLYQTKNYKNILK